MCQNREVNNRAVKFTLVALLFTQPLLFFRGLQEAFDLSKFLVAIPLGGFLVAAVIFSTEFRRVRGPAFWGLVAFLGTMVVSTAASISPLTSLYGQPQRYTGLVLFLVCASVFVACQLGYVSLASMRTIALWNFVGSSAYVHIQFHGLDPFRWSTSSFSGQVTGLMGNPNTSAAMLGILSVFPFSMIFTSKSWHQRLAACCIYLFGTSAIGLTESFMGVLQIIGVVGLIVLFVKGDPSDNLSSPWFTGSIAAVLGLFLSLSARPFIVFLIAVGVVLVADLVKVEKRIQITRPRFILGAILVSPALLFQRSTILSGVQSGFLERGDFYRAAWSIFRSHPITGSGIDTYGRMFPTHRPSSHALRLEDSISNSAHNLYLGLLANGGLLVFVSFVILLGLVATHVRRNFRHSTSEIGIVVASVVNFLFIGLFSVEHLALWVMLFALLGVLSSDSLPLGKRKPRSQARSVSIVPISLGILTSLIFTFVFARPLYSSARLQARVDTELMPAGRIGDALVDTKTAYELTSWNGISQLRLGEIQLRAGDRVGARKNFVEGLAKEGYSPLVARTAASILYSYEDFEGTLEVVDLTTKVLELPPQTAELFEKLCSDIAQISLNAGDVSMNARADLLLKDVQSKRLKSTT